MTVAAGDCATGRAWERKGGEKLYCSSPGGWRGAVRCWQAMGTTWAVAGSLADLDGGFVRPFLFGPAQSGLPISRRRNRSEEGRGERRQQARAGRAAWRMALSICGLGVSIPFFMDWTANGGESRTAGRAGQS